MNIIIGLGNPGAQYENTRHNMGFVVIDLLARAWGISVARAHCRALAGEGRVGGERVALLKPQTFMNASGDCVQAALNWYKLPPRDVLIISDDIDLPPGAVRVRASGGAGTHNGWRDILQKTGSGDFPRVRVGTGAPPPGWDLADWVLSRPDGDARALMEEACQRAAQAAMCYVREGIDRAMNAYNKRAPSILTPGDAGRESP